MAITQKNRGFTLLIALIFMSVMLSFALSLGSLAYKQASLASDAKESQYAFYAADAALECALYADNHDAVYAYDNFGCKDPSDVNCSFDKNFMSCDGNTTITVHQSTPTGGRLISTATVPLDRDASGTYTHCADITVYKPAPPNLAGVSYLFSLGYDVPCAVVSLPGARVLSRGISVHF